MADLDPVGTFLDLDNTRASAVNPGVTRYRWKEFTKPKIVGHLKRSILLFRPHVYVADSAFLNNLNFERLLEHDQDFGEFVQSGRVRPLLRESVDSFSELFREQERQGQIGRCRNIDYAAKLDEFARPHARRWSLDGAGRRFEFESEARVARHPAVKKQDHLFSVLPKVMDRAKVHAAEEQKRLYRRHVYRAIKELVPEPRQSDRRKLEAFFDVPYNAVLPLEMGLPYQPLANPDRVYKFLSDETFTHRAAVHAEELLNDVLSEVTSQGMSRFLATALSEIPSGAILDWIEGKYYGDHVAAHMKFEASPQSYSALIEYGKAAIQYFERLSAWLMEFRVDAFPSVVIPPKSRVRAVTKGTGKTVLFGLAITDPLGTLVNMVATEMVNSARTDEERERIAVFVVDRLVARKGGGGRVHHR